MEICSVASKILSSEYFSIDMNFKIHFSIKKILCSKYFYNHLKSFCSNTSKYLKSHSSLLDGTKIKQKILASTINYICFLARASGFLADILGRFVIPEALSSFSWEFYLAYFAKWEMDTDVPTLYDIWESNFVRDLQEEVL